MIDLDNPTPEQQKEIDRAFGIETFEEKYNVVIECNYCKSKCNANIKKGLPKSCPTCRRNSMSNFENPSDIAEWLTKHYSFLTTADLDRNIMVYEDGVWSNKRAMIIIESETKLLKAKKLKSNDMSNICLHLRASTYTDRTFLNNCVVQKENALYINFNNCVVRFERNKEGKLIIERLEHSPSYYFMGKLPVEYKEDALFPDYTIKFIDEISPDPFGFITLLEGLAYPLIPDYPIQQAITLVGKGGNGKSTYMHLLEMIYGKKNTSNVSLQQLSSAAYSQPFILTRFYGKMLNISDDLPSKSVTDVGYFKELTGGSTVEAERKFGATFNFQNSAKMYFAANQMPAVSEDTFAFWRRFCFVEFIKPIKNPVSSTVLNAIFEKELPGLMLFLLKGVVSQLLDKVEFTCTDTAEETALIYAKNSNSSMLFCKTMVNYEEGSEVLKSEIWAKYKIWCKKMELVEVNEKRFWMTFFDGPFEEKKIQHEGIRKLYAVNVFLKPEIPSNSENKISKHKIENAKTFFINMKKLLSDSGVCLLFDYSLQKNSTINVYMDVKIPAMYDNTDTVDIDFGVRGVSGVENPCHFFHEGNNKNLETSKNFMPNSENKSINSENKSINSEKCQGSSSNPCHFDFMPNSDNSMQNNGKETTNNFIQNSENGQKTNLENTPKNNQENGQENTPKTDPKNNPENYQKIELGGLCVICPNCAKNTYDLWEFEKKWYCESCKASQTGVGVVSG